MLERLRRQRDEMRARLTDLRNLTTDMTDEQLAEVDQLLRDLPALDERVSGLEAEERRAALLAADRAAGDEQARADVTRSPAVVTSEPDVYRRGGTQSYFRDLACAQLRGDRSAFDRLERNARQVADLRGEERALSTTDGAGGDFVPPAWMVDEFVGLARAARVTANLVRQEPLPAGTDSINLPRLATGTAVAEQATQNTAVQNTDATTNAVTASVVTLAGQQVVALQLIEQSPANMDSILLADLAADYATKLDLFVIQNNAAGKRGLLSVSGVNAVTYTDATPTAGELYAKLADSIQQVHTGRFLPPEVIVMHPRRWAFFLAALDTQNRPLVVPSTGSPYNGLGSAGDVRSEGFVGTLQGLPVYVDPNIPINLGAGTNEDRIIVLRASDVILMESTPRSEAFRETKADQLSVLLRFYNYAALHSERYPKAISVVSGTGLITPTF